MDTDIDGQSLWSRMVAQWQPVVLVTACVAAGLTLTTMVIGSTPDVVVEASEAAVEAAPVDTPVAESAVATEVPVDTTVPESTEVVDPGADAVAADPGALSAAPLQPATVVAPAPGAAPAAPNPAPTAAPTTAGAPAPAPVVTSAPLAPVTVAAPQATPAPTTAAPAPVTLPPAPTTATPAPTTAPPAPALTYPSYSAGSAATVVLQFDGSSIYVASITRQPNWVAQIDKNGPRTIEIKFFNTATQQSDEFHATVENGRIKVEN